MLRPGSSFRIQLALAAVMAASVCVSACRTLGTYQMPTAMDPSMVAYLGTLNEDERPLAIITAEIAPGVEYHLRAVVDAQERLLGIHLYEPDQLRVIRLDDLARGTVLVETENAEAITVKSGPGFSPENGGLLELTYLTSATWNTHDDVVLTVARAPRNGPWSAFQPIRDGARPRFTRMHLRGTRGITEIVYR